MVPAPWFREIAEAACLDRTLDIGVHLTLTSEWDACRWAPISTVSRTTGLIDDDGYFWRDVDSLRRHVVPEAAEVELRMQVERAIAAGIRPTHLDAHMAAAMLPELLDVHVRLGRDYGLFPVLPRTITWAPDLVAYRTVIAALDAEGVPVVDHCRGTLAVDSSKLETGWRKLIAELPLGTTHLALHCTTRGEFQEMAPAHAAWRFAEYDFLSSGLLNGFCTAEDVAVIGTRTFQELWVRD